MKKILIIFSGIILSCIMVYGIWICVVNRNTDDYLDNDNVSREIISYKGDKNNLEYNIIMCNYKKIKECLNKGADSNKMFKNLEKTPLMLSATLPNYKEAIKISNLLINKGANIKRRNSYGANVLFYVGYYEYDSRSSKDNIKLLKYYISKGAETNIKIHGIDSDGNLTPKGKSVSLVQFYYSKGMEEEAKFLKQQQ